jgi:hypothetical protein
MGLAGCWGDKSLASSRLKVRPYLKKALEDEFPPRMAQILKVILLNYRKEPEGVYQHVIPSGYVKIAMKPWPIEIDGLPNLIAWRFSMLNYQRVN